MDFSKAFFWFFREFWNCSRVELASRVNERDFSMICGTMRAAECVLVLVNRRKLRVYGTGSSLLAFWVTSVVTAVNTIVRNS